MRTRHWWIAFTLLSSLLLGGYTVGLSNESLQPFLKGLNSLQHFGIHYVVGAAAALAVLSIWLHRTNQRANEPLVLLVTVLLSHFPDFRFAFRRQEHESWEVIFLGHTAVDDAFNPLFYIFLAITVGLYFLYRRQNQKANILRTTRS